jgi:hypothetical protein
MSLLFLFWDVTVAYQLLVIILIGVDEGVGKLPKKMKKPAAVVGFHYM